MASGGCITSNFGERFSTSGNTMKFILLMYNNETLWNRMTKAEQDAAVDRRCGGIVGAPRERDGVPYQRAGAGRRRARLASDRWTLQ